MKAIITVGVSGSGKSTWADGFIKEEREAGREWVKVERDCIRRILFHKRMHDEFSWSRWNPKWEREVTSIHEDSLLAAANTGKNVVVSDTNLTARFRDRLAGYLRTLGFVVEFRDFPVTWEVAVQRDLNRQFSVGSSVISKQFEKWFEYSGRRVATFVPNLPDAIVVDIDGTLAHKCNRDIYDSSAAINDSVDVEVREMVRAYHKMGCKVIVVTGRRAEDAEVTFRWLQRHDIPHDALFTRASQDFRGDEIVKEEIYFTNIDPYVNVRAVFDDRPKVCRMWRDIGLKVFQCGNPHVEF